MILADTSVWIEHLRRGDARLESLLESGGVFIHPFIIGELALGNLRQRDTVLGLLRDLPQALPASDEEVLGFIETYGLSGTGIGYIDAHLLASARLMAASLWTRDKRLRTAAVRLGLADGAQVL
jgi:predicted nucleic acid-binding protein